MLPSRTYALHSPHKPDLGFLPCPNLSFELPVQQGGGEKLRSYLSNMGRKTQMG